MSRAGPTHRRQVPSLKGCLSNGGGRSARSGPEPAYWLLVLRFSPAASMSVAAISTACAGHLLDATPPSLRGRVTLLVAGAPYVPLGAAELLPREARDYEPAQALFGGHHGLDYVRELVNAARPWLASDARVLTELHSGQYEAAAHAERTGFNTRRHDGRVGPMPDVGRFRKPFALRDNEPSVSTR